MKIYLVPEDGSRPYELVKDITLVGRSRICDIQLLDKSVSKLHCVLVKTDSLVLVRDLGSTNGTRVKDLTVKRGFLLPNDVLEIARLRFHVQFLPDDAAPPTPTESWVRTEQMSRQELEQLLQAAEKEDSVIDDGPPSSPLPPGGPEVVGMSPPENVPSVPPIPPVVETDQPAP
jgi:pSer/pThr/pTyr-binding forkhead associated (FHA) protein